MRGSVKAVTEAIERFLRKNDGILKDKQIEIVMSIVRAFGSGHRAVYVEAPTGLGKTVITSQLLRALNGQKRLPRILVVTPSIKLVEDAWKKIRAFAPELHTGLYYTFAKDNAPITISTYASFPKLAQTVAEEFDLVILDEGHHILSKNLLGHLVCFKKALWLALTATPGYSPQRHLSQHFHLAHKTTIHEAIDADLISGYRNVLVFARAVNLDQIPLARSGDFAAPSLERAVNVNTRNGAAVDFYRRSIDPETGVPLLGQKAIINCVGIDHANDIARLFCEKITKKEMNGRIPCAAIHGNMYRKDIQRVLDAHKAGEIACLAQAKLIGEGHDDVGVKLVMNLKPSLSFVEVPQRGGRALRYDTLDETNAALIVDFVDEGTLQQKLPLLFAEITGSAAYHKWMSSQIKRKKYKGLPRESDTLRIEWEAALKRPNYMRIPGIEVVWSSEHIAEILKKRASIRLGVQERGPLNASPRREGDALEKDEDWLSSHEIAACYGVPQLLILRLFHRFQTDKKHKGIKIDTCGKERWHIEWRYHSGEKIECLHKEELESFGQRYRLNMPLKTDEWLTCGEIIDRLSEGEEKKFDTDVISKIFWRSKSLEENAERRHDPLAQKEWRIARRRHKLKRVICLHRDDFELFCKEYHLDAPEHSGEYMSPEQILFNLSNKRSATQASVQKSLKSCLERDGDPRTDLSWAIQYRCVNGRPLLCLRKSAFQAFDAYHKIEVDRRAADRLAYLAIQREKGRAERLEMARRRYQ